MTHDFHYYCTFMCARNAGFSPSASHKIALCADAVDGWDQRSYEEAKLPSTTRGGKRPVTVLHGKSNVHTYRSMGSSIMIVPWLAFHFFPSLELDATKTANRFAIKRFIDKGKSKKFPENAGEDEKKEMKISQLLESGFICCKDAQTSKLLIKHTADYIKKGSVNKNEISDFDAAFLGLRSHIIADLFAHEGFAGCRSMNINALSNIQILRKYEYSTTTIHKFAPIGKAVGVSRFGHGQAGNTPDEPYCHYMWTRLRDGNSFQKDNYELFGAAMMTVTEALKGNVVTDFKNWRSHVKDHKYKWDHFKICTNQKRIERNISLMWYINGVEIETMKKLEKNKTVVHKHDSDDYWTFSKMNLPLKRQFSDAADKHLKWFHETFYRIAHCNVAQYLEVTLLWKASENDYKKALEYNKALLSNKKVDNSSPGYMSPSMIGVEYMNANKSEKDLKPSDVRSILEAGIHKVFPPPIPLRKLKPPPIPKNIPKRTKKY